MQLRTSAFKPGDNVPLPFTCDGANVSPPLTWTAPPDGTESLAVIVDDPDAPHRTWTHWLVYNVPPTERELSEAIAPRSELASGAQQGRNDFGDVGYGGPCPPPGRPHRYFFRVFALDTQLTFPTAPSREQIDRAMRGHVLASGQIMGHYRRKQ